jgi:hypothetical protein
MIPYVFSSDLDEERAPLNAKAQQYRTMRFFCSRQFNLSNLVLMELTHSESWRLLELERVVSRGIIRTSVAVGEMVKKQTIDDDIDEELRAIDVTAAASL